MYYGKKGEYHEIVCMMAGESDLELLQQAYACLEHEEPGTQGFLLRSNIVNMLNKIQLK
jgi:hypothetical protein